MGVLLRALHGEELVVRADIPADLPGVCIEPARLTYVVLCLMTVAEREPGRAGTRGECEAEPASEIDSAEIAVSACLALHERAVILNITEKRERASLPRPAHARGPFFTATSDGAGEGFGVPTARRLIADVGGRVRFNCVAGEGTTAAIELPIGAEQDRVLAEPI